MSFSGKGDTSENMMSTTSHNFRSNVSVTFGAYQGSSRVNNVGPRLFHMSELTHSLDASCCCLIIYNFGQVQRLINRVTGYILWSGR